MSQQDDPSGQQPLDYGATDERGLIEAFERNPQLRLFAGAALIALAALVAYLPAIRGHFVWDDDYYVTHNRLLRNAEGLQRIWFGVVPSPSKYPLPQYYPMTHTSFWFEYRLWKLNPTGYHLTNVLLHIASGLLIWLILKRLEVGGAWAAGAIFAVHPINVESVAWIAERKNVLCGFFFFSSIYIYLRYCGLIAKPAGVAAGGGSRQYLTLPDDRARIWAMALVLFFCALASKTIASTMPAVVLLLIWWKRGKISLKDDILPLLPFFALAIGAAILTGWMEVHRVGAVGADWNQTPVERVLIAGRVVWFYAMKLLVPYPLIFNYPRWDVRASDAVQWIYPIAAIAVVVILWLNRRRWGRGPLVAVLYYAGTLVPAMGFVNVFPMRYSFVADHFAYLSTIGLIALACAGAVRLAGEYLDPERATGVLAGAAAVAIIACFALANAHAGIFEGPASLWKDTLDKTDQKSWMAANNYGEFLMQSGDPAKIETAEKWFEKVLRLRPQHAEARLNLGRIAEARKQPEEAIRWYEESLRYRLDSPALYRIGSVRLAQGQLDAAAEQFRRVIQLNPDDENAHLILGKVYAQQEKSDEAIREFEAANDLNPESAAPFLEIGNLLVKQQKFDDAMRYLRRAAELEPDNPAVNFTVGTVFASSGYLPEAKALLQKAVRLSPNSAEAHRQLGVVLALQGKPDEARRELETALKIDPDSERAKANLAALNEGRLKPATTQATQPATREGR